MPTPDPIAQPQAYQRHLLALLGEDDPALVQAETGPALAKLVAQVGPQLRDRPAPREWSVIECVGHLVDAEIVYASRYRWILAHCEPNLIGYDQDLWVDRLRHVDDDSESLLRLFGILRDSNLDLWERIPRSERSRAGIHAERGAESYELSFRLIAGHDRFHLDQTQRTVAAVTT